MKQNAKMIQSSLWAFTKCSCLFNSRTAIAGAIIGLLLVFYNSKNLNCIGALSFYDSKRSIGEVLFFLINFIGVIFKAGNETREKMLSGFCAEQN